MTRAVVLAVCGVALAVVAGLLRQGAFAHAWLAATFTLLGWPLGSIALLLTHALTGGRWGEAVQVPLRLGVLGLPIALIAAVPLAFTLPALYPWLHPDVARDLQNTWYLNAPFFACRAAIYVIAWLGIAALTLLAPLARIAPGCLIALALTTSFAAIDLTASLDPTFSSSVYGMLSGTGMVLFALSVALLLALPRAAGRARDDLGKLLLALCVLWAYLDFVQLIVVWSSNLEADAPWYAKRLAGFWGWSLGAMAALHAVLPILILAIPRFRRNDKLVMALAALLVLSGVLRSWWLVLPEAGRTPGLADIACMLGLLMAAFGLAVLTRRLPALLRRPVHA